MQFGRNFLKHTEAEILKHRNRFRQGNEAAAAIDFKTQPLLAIQRLAIETCVTLAVIVELENMSSKWARGSRTEHMTP